MLNVNTLPNRKDRKILRTSTIILSWDHDRKERKKVKKHFQNKCVNSQNHRYKKRRGRHGRRLSAILFPTFSQRADATVVRRAERADKKSKPSGNTHKIPEKTNYRVVASTKFSEFNWLALQNRWNKYKKMQNESEKAD